MIQGKPLTKWSKDHSFYYKRYDFTLEIFREYPHTVDSLLNIQKFKDPDDRYKLLKTLVQIKYYDDKMIVLSLNDLNSTDARLEKINASQKSKSACDLVISLIEHFPEKVGIPLIEMIKKPSKKNIIPLTYILKEIRELPSNIENAMIGSLVNLEPISALSTPDKEYVMVICHRLPD